MIVEITPVMITNIQYKSYIVFAIFNFVTIPIVYFTYPETCGLPLEAVDLLFADRDGKRPSIFRVVKDSRKKEFMAGIQATLQERARGREETKTSPEREKHGVAELESNGVDRAV